MHTYSWVAEWDDLAEQMIWGKKHWNKAIVVDFPSTIMHSGVILCHHLPSFCPSCWDGGATVFVVMRSSLLHEDNFPEMKPCRICRQAKHIWWYHPICLRAAFLRACPTWRFKRIYYRITDVHRGFSQHIDWHKVWLHWVVFCPQVDQSSNPCALYHHSSEGTTLGCCNWPTYKKYNCRKTCSIIHVYIYTYLCIQIFTATCRTQYLYSVSLWVQRADNLAILCTRELTNTDTSSISA